MTTPERMDLLSKTYKARPSFFGSLRKSISLWVRRHPLCFYTYMIFRPPPRLRTGDARETRASFAATGKILCEKDTELVIEAFPRSGNIFAATAFHMAQQRDTRLAYGFHCPAQIIRAVKYRIPVLTFIRNPDDAVASLMIHSPHVSAENGFRHYCDFYGEIYPYRAQIVIATFEQITKNLGAIIEKINRKYGTQFVLFDHNKENESNCFKLIEEESKKIRDVLPNEERTLSRPSKQREQDKPYVLEIIRSTKVSSYREKAFKIYEDYRREIESMGDIP